jgi:hypothetical protein
MHILDQNPKSRIHDSISGGASRELEEIPRIRDEFFEPSWKSYNACDVKLTSRKLTSQIATK